MMKNFYTTSEASKLLGISSTSVQKLVENNTLQAWKTDGGHRRITIESLEGYMQALNIPNSIGSSKNGFLKVLAIDDDPERLAYLNKLSSKTNNSFKFIVSKFNFELLIELEEINPDILIIDNKVSSISALNLLNFIKKKKSFNHLSCIIVNHTSNTDATIFPLPSKTIFIEKPLNTDWLNGFVAASRISRRSLLEQSSSKFDPEMSAYG